MYSTNKLAPVNTIQRSSPLDKTIIIENQGGGNCGYLSVALGLIYKLQEDLLTENQAAHIFQYCKNPIVDDDLEPNRIYLSHVPAAENTVEKISIQFINIENTDCHLLIPLRDFELSAELTKELRDKFKTQALCNQVSASFLDDQFTDSEALIYTALISTGVIVPSSYASIDSFFRSAAFQEHQQQKYGWSTQNNFVAELKQLNFAVVKQRNAFSQKFNLLLRQMLSYDQTLRIEKFKHGKIGHDAHYLLSKAYQVYMHYFNEDLLSNDVIENELFGLLQYKRIKLELIAKAQKDRNNFLQVDNDLFRNTINLESTIAEIHDILIRSNFDGLPVDVVEEIIARYGNTAQLGQEKKIVMRAGFLNLFNALDIPNKQHYTNYLFSLLNNNDIKTFIAYCERIIQTYPNIFILPSIDAGTRCGLYFHDTEDNINVESCNNLTNGSAAYIIDQQNRMYYYTRFPKPQCMLLNTNDDNLLEHDFLKQRKTIPSLSTAQLNIIEQHQKVKHERNIAARDTIIKCITETQSSKQRMAIHSLLEEQDGHNIITKIQQVRSKSNEWATREDITRLTELFHVPCYIVNRRGESSYGHAPHNEHGLSIKLCNYANTHWVLVVSPDEMQITSIMHQMISVINLNEKPRLEKVLLVKLVSENNDIRDMLSYFINNNYLLEPIINFLCSSVIDVFINNDSLADLPFSTLIQYSTDENYQLLIQKTIENYQELRRKQWSPAIFTGFSQSRKFAAVAALIEHKEEITVENAEISLAKEHVTVLHNKRLAQLLDLLAVNVTAAEADEPQPALCRWRFGKR